MARHRRLRRRTARSDPHWTDCQQDGLDETKRNPVVTWPPQGLGDGSAPLRELCGTIALSSRPWQRRYERREGAAGISHGTFKKAPRDLSLLLVLIKWRDKRDTRFMQTGLGTKDSNARLHHTNQYVLDQYRRRHGPCAIGSRA
jgi:hypothetical protein